MRVYYGDLEVLDRFGSVALVSETRRLTEYGAAGITLLIKYLTMFVALRQENNKNWWQNNKNRWQSCTVRVLVGHGQWNFVTSSLVFCFSSAEVSTLLVTCVGFPTWQWISDWLDGTVWWATELQLTIEWQLTLHEDLVSSKVQFRECVFSEHLRGFIKVVCYNRVTVGLDFYWTSSLVLHVCTLLK